jgi:hypothetical protein
MVGENMARQTRSLEELNRAYKREIQTKRRPRNIGEMITNALPTTSRQVSRKKRQRAEVEMIRRLVVIGAIVFLLLAGIFFAIQNLRTSNKIVPTILTAKELENWQDIEVQEGKIYVELNGKIEVDNKKANIRLVNPIYSAYTISIELWEKKEENNLLYESEKLKPGTILEMIRLSEPLTEGETEGVVNYIIYDEEGNEKASHPIDITFIQKDMR